MKKNIGILLAILVLYSCISSKPKDFSFQYGQNYTGLDTLINIKGYYLAQRECDSTFYSIFKFYPDGLFSIITLSDTSLIKQNIELEKYASWGLYEVHDDTIKTQTIRQEGIGFSTIFRDYKIHLDKTITNISDYVIPKNTNIGYMVNYPSFYRNPCPLNAKFYSSNNIKTSLKCPYLKKAWFNHRHSGK